MTATDISDEVWQQLDRNAGRMSRRGFVLFLVACLALAGVGSGGLIAWRTVAQPLAADDDFLTYSATGGEHKVFSFQVRVRNQGIVPLTIVRAGADAPGLRLVAPGPASGQRVNAGQDFTLTLEYEVTDCAAVPTAALPLPLVVDQSWGRRTVHVQPQRMSDPALGDGYFVNPAQVEWQTAMTYYTCRMPT